MKAILKSFPHSKITISLVIFNLLLIASVFLLKNALPPVIPIYFGMPTGSQQLGPSYALSLPPLASLIVTLIDSIIITLSDDKFLQKTLLAISFVTTFLSTFAFVRIFMLVGSF